MNFNKLISLSIIVISGILTHCAEPVESNIHNGLQIPAIDDSARISIVTWNIKHFPQAGSRTTDRIALIMDSLNADFYCLQEIQDKTALQNIIDGLEQYSVIISDETSYLHLSIVYKQEFFLPVLTESLFAHDDYYFASRPPLFISFLYEQGGGEQVLNLIDVHMKCCEKDPSDVERRHNASQMLYDYMQNARAYGDSNFVVVGDWNDDIHDPDGSGTYAFEALLEDTDNYLFITDSLSATRLVRNASYPSWNSFLDNMLISRSLFDEYANSEIRTLRLDEIFGDYNSVVSDHRPVLWIFTPNNTGPTIFNHHNLDEVKIQ